MKESPVNSVHPHRHIECKDPEYHSSHFPHREPKYNVTSQSSCRTHLRPAPTFFFQTSDRDLPSLRGASANDIFKNSNCVFTKLGGELTGNVKSLPINENFHLCSGELREVLGFKIKFANVFTDQN